jgi:hypothetical protein
VYIKGLENNCCKRESRIEASLFSLRYTQESVESTSTHTHVPALLLLFVCVRGRHDNNAAVSNIQKKTKKKNKGNDELYNVLVQERNESNRVCCCISI